MSNHVHKTRKHKNKSKHRHKKSSKKKSRRKSKKKEEINSSKEFLKALDRIARSGDYRINLSTCLPLLRIKYKHFIQYIDGWFDKFNKTERISMINEVREKQSQRIDICEAHSINLIMSRDMYYKQKKNWNVRLRNATVTKDNKNILLSKYRPILSCITLFIKNLPTTFTNSYPSPLELKSYLLTFSPSESSVKELINKLKQIPSWYLLQRHKNTFQQILYFLDCNDKSVTLKSLLYSPIISPASGANEIPELDLNEFGIPPDDFCSFNPINPKKRKRAIVSEIEQVKKRKLVNKANYYKEKYLQMTSIAKHLYNEVVDGENPRWHLVNFVRSKSGVIRDAELDQLRKDTVAKHVDDGYVVEGLNKWKSNTVMEKRVKTYLELNGDYCRAKCVMVCNGMNLLDMMEKYKIANHPRIKMLNGQFGVRAKCDIAKQVVLGQYTGAEITREAFGKVFDDTGHEYHHNVFAFDQQVDESKWFVIDPQIGEAKGEMIFRFVNDCREDIAASKPTKEDNKYFNVEFVGMRVNGWPQTYVVSKRKIKKGEELMTFYGGDFHNAITLKVQSDQFKMARKKRVDANILKGFKL